MLSRSCILLAVWSVASISIATCSHPPSPSSTQYPIIHSRAPGRPPVKNPTVKIDNARIRGQYSNIRPNGYDDLEGPTGYYSFSNIRYALSPTGKLRFEKPVAPHPNSTSDDLQAHWLKAPVCPQAFPSWMCLKHATTYSLEDGSPEVTKFSYNWCRKAEEKAMANLRQTEDCLFLDVHVPRGVFENETNRRCKYNITRAPVIVSFGTTPFIYGSKEQTSIGGASPAVLTRHAPIPDEKACPQLYPIVVSINYRLGMFGWFNGKKGTPNLGLWDQRLALEWVHTYIERFNGDPKRITLVGMGSGGGGSVAHQIVAFGGEFNSSPAQYYNNNVTTPFQKAIIMSPNWDQFPDLDATYKAVMDAATKLSGNNISSIEQLKSLDSKILIQVNRKVVKDAPKNRDVFGPVVGGEFIPNHPSVLLRDKKFDHTTYVIVGRGLYHHLRSAPMGYTAEQVHSQMAELLHGYSNATLDYIINKLYNNTARDSLSQWYEPRKTKRLSPASIPVGIRSELHVMDEINVGCHTRNIAKGFSLAKNTSWAYDSGAFTPNNMMGLFNQDTLGRFEGKEVQPFGFRERFLQFAIDGNPNPPTMGGGWGRYSDRSPQQVMEKNLESDWKIDLVKDVYDNERCDWWVKEGYERLEKEGGRWFEE